MFLDVDERPIKYSIGFFAFSLLILIIPIGCIYAYFNSKQLAVSPIFAIGMCIGGIQVSIQF